MDSADVGRAAAGGAAAGLAEVDCADAGPAKNRAPIAAPKNAVLNEFAVVMACLSSLLAVREKEWGRAEGPAPI